MAIWIDDVRQWPPVTDDGIQEYFIHHLASDDQQNANYRSLIEGQNYLNSGWVGQILHTLPDDEHITVRAPVRFSQTINSQHNVKLTLQRRDGKVVNVDCDCMANRGKCCSHTAGVLYKMKYVVTQGLTGVSCSDKLCAWNQSTWKNVLPDTIENIRRPDHAHRESMKLTTKAFESDADVIQHFSSPQLAGLAMIPGTILHHVLTAQPQRKATDELPKEHAQCADHKCTLCNIVFETYVKCRKDDREKIERKSKGQDGQFWLDQRKIRITSSQAFGVPRKINPSNWVERKLNAEFEGCAATRYGQLSEPLARKWFEKTTGQTVETTGLIVHEEENWLGASLDGIIDTNTILEIKCPTAKKLEAHDGSLRKMIESNKYDVKYVNGMYILKETASGLGYYYQVQVAMCCAKKNNCKFLVWTPNEQVIVDVRYNQQWTEEHIRHLKKVYFEHLLPAMATRIAHGVMTVRGL
ncbi:uncharacterized protein LOC121638361 [Melanotaenia boesemani]|uniref:uncharacterized protein LOC121638361 n=1 Tax=Melanotaenia boesemani TaxID=1250792 RepID=UPI001C03B3BD|nr:uncharacterized protein LOC121638361 [Melanotaenia boesemani]